MASVTFSLEPEVRTKLEAVRDTLVEFTPKAKEGVQAFCEHAKKTGLDSYIRDTGILEEAYSVKLVSAAEQLADAITAFVNYYKKLDAFQS